MKKKEQTKKVAKSATKGKKATASAQPQAKALERKRIEVAAHQLRSAPWNPRPEITSESVADITASIREIGLIQPLVVMKDPEKKPVGGVDFYLVVAGHRRFKACVDAGLSPIPCDVIDCDVPTAKRVTMIENLQRKDADPLMEADLIAGLIADGMTQAEIAAETGRGEKWVARRANLVKLSKSWRKRVADGEQITIDCLEHVAAYPAEIQEKLKKADGGYYSNGALTWKDVKYKFVSESRNLKEAIFDTTACLKCPNNSGCSPELFDDLESGATLGKCLNAKCYAEKVDDQIETTVSKAKARGHTVVNGRPYDNASYTTSKRPTKTHTALYVYTDCTGAKVMEWGSEPKKKSAADNQADDEKALAEKREKRERNKAIRKLAEWCGSGEPGEPCNLAKLLDGFFRGTPTEAPYLVQEAFMGLDGWHFQGCNTNKQLCAISAIFGNFTVPYDTWARYAAAAIIRQLDPSKNEGYRAKHNAELLAVMFPKELLDAIGAEAFAHVRGDKPKDDIVNPAIEWCVEGEDADAEPDPDDMEEETT